jgi:hypothetical protein
MTTLTGMAGTNPRDFLAALGVLRIASGSFPEARLSFRDGGAFPPVIDGMDAESIIGVVVEDAEAQAGPQPWKLEYEKNEKRGTKRVADLKPPPEVFRSFLRSSLEAWRKGAHEGAAYAGAFATDVAVDGKGNTKPTAFHFTAANQQFLDTVERIRARVDRDWSRQALFEGHAERSGPNLRWDPHADRAYALMAADPNADGTAVNAPLEWLAFRALPLLPVVPIGARAQTTGTRGRGDEMRFRWPLWSEPASLAAAGSLVRLDWSREGADRWTSGVFAVCTSDIHRTGQGFGNFGPAVVAPPAAEGPRGGAMRRRLAERA